MPKTFTCRNCPFTNGVDHEVTKEERDEHRLLVLQHHATAGSLPHSATPAASATLPAPHSAPEPRPPDENSLERLADLVTAMVLTDDGPTPLQQPSKLFDSREAVQEMRAPDIPEKFQPIPFDEASRSVATLIQRAATATPQMLPSTRRSTKGKETLDEIDSRVTGAINSLTAPLARGTAMLNTLATASETAQFATDTFRALKPNVNLKEQREHVESNIRILQKHIDVLSARIRTDEPISNDHGFSNPLAFAGVEPMRYNAGEP
ncbi:hypothetical protein R3P38DRAFT_2765148 [Favolaschia claudopus]|uniref:Uncharacterized protein n=1 Tax=Favolaschia claudopus TaxID=2862362 RepID=A0AAW0D4Y6_9AGAR